jgi:hypothetical protein
MTPAMDRIQEAFDYYIEQGGTYVHLRMLVMQEIGRVLEQWETNKEDASWVLTNYIPKMQELYEALQGIDELLQERRAETDPEVGEDDATVQDLRDDYQIYCRSLEESEAGQREPYEYMEAYFDACEMPRRVVVRAFLEQYHEPKEVGEWIEKFAWEEDEFLEQALDHNLIRDEVREALEAVVRKYAPPEKIPEVFKELEERLDLGFVTNLGDFFSQVVMSIEERRE